jgi:hypothetical protein
MKTTGRVAVKNQWLVNFLKWALGTENALAMEQPDFGVAMEMAVAAMCQIADTAAEKIEAAKIGLLEVYRRGQITHDEYLFGVEYIKCWQLKHEMSGDG